MTAGDISQLPNPFAPEPPPSPTRRALISACKWMAVAIIGILSLTAYTMWQGDQSNVDEAGHDVLYADAGSRTATSELEYPPSLPPETPTLRSAIVQAGFTEFGTNGVPPTEFGTNGVLGENHDQSAQPIERGPFVDEDDQSKPTLRFLKAGQTAELSDIRDPVTHKETVFRFDEAAIDRRPSLDEAPSTSEPTLQSAKLASLIRIMGSDQPILQTQAHQELGRRGLSQEEMAIAHSIATGDVAHRYEIIDTVTNQNTFDARPWLLLLLDDQDRRVKLRAIDALARTLEPDVRKHLRVRLVSESDQTIVFRIRQVLNLR